MKKKIAIILIGACAASMVFAGCGSDSTESGSSAVAEASTSAEEEDTVVDAETLLSASDYDISDYVKLNDYMNMTVDISEDMAVTEQSVTDYINDEIPYYPYQPSDKQTVEDGDVVEIEYDGTIDGESFDGGSTDGTPAQLEIGSDSYIDGFEDGLIGANVGDTVTLNLTFPDDYSEDSVAGKDVVFTVTIDQILEDVSETMTADTLTDEYVAYNFDQDNVADFKEATKEEVAEMNEYYQDSYVQQAVIDKLMEECEVTVPDGMVEEQQAEVLETVEGYAESYGMSVDEYFQQATGYTQEEYMEQIASYVKEQLILEAILKDMNYSMSMSDFNDFVASYTEYYGVDEDTLFEESGGEAQVMLSYAENEVLQKVVDATTVVGGSDDSSADSTEDSSAQ